MIYKTITGSVGPEDNVESGKTFDLQVPGQPPSKPQTTPGYKYLRVGEGRSSVPSQFPRKPREKTFL